MKIVFITNNFPPTVDGVGDHTCILADKFAALNYEVSVICRKSNSTNKRLNNFNLYSIVDDWNWKNIKKVVEILMQINPKWVILQYVPYAYQKKGLPFEMIKLCYEIKKKYRLAIIFHEVHIKINFLNIKNLLHGLPMQFISKCIYLLSNHSFVSNPFYSTLLTENSAKISLVRIGSNLIPNKRISDDCTLDMSILGILRANFVIASFGKGIKNLNLILDAFLAITEEKQDSILLLLGGLPNKDIALIDSFKLKNSCIKDSIIITGFLDAAKILKYLDFVDVFISLEYSNCKSYHWNGISTKSGVLAAAFSKGLPVISTKGELTDSFFQSGDNILLLEQTSLDDLYFSIKELKSNSRLRKKLSKNAMISYKTALRWNVITKSYLKKLEQ